MGSAAYNRGSRLVSKEADERMPLATARADRQAHKDEVARLREQIATLERDLRRARRCLARGSRPTASAFGTPRAVGSRSSPMGASSRTGAEAPTSTAPLLPQRMTVVRGPGRRSSTRCARTAPRRRQGRRRSGPTPARGSHTVAVPRAADRHRGQRQVVEPPRKRLSIPCVASVWSWAVLVSVTRLHG